MRRITSAFRLAVLQINLNLGDSYVLGTRRTLWSACLAAFITSAVPAAAAPAPLPFAVLGDSDSHSYHDDVWFGRDPSARGGRHRASTFQWTEVLAGLRPQHLDPGPRTLSGWTYRRVADAVEWFGFPSRHPRKRDYEYNFAISGAVCEDLHEGHRRQLPRLLATMKSQPQRWADGIVLIRIGTNSFGKANMLDRLARDPQDAVATKVIDACVSHIARAVSTLRAAHPRTRVVLVGIFNNAHWARYHARWQSAREQANLESAMGRFDAGLRALAETDARAAFFDDQAWFRSLWGSRDADGKPAYRAVRFGAWSVTNTAGDEPWNATLADGHAGTVWNSLWALALVDLMNRRFGLAVRPIDKQELVDFVERSVAGKR
jgi:hypothetical protein